VFLWTADSSAVNCPGERHHVNRLNWPDALRFLWMQIRG
jgi:hypothetical protein